MTASISKNKRYKKNYLNNVIFKIDFSPILELTEKTPPSQLQGRISDYFPKSKIIKGGMIEYEVTNDFNFDLKKRENKTTWIFSNKENTKKVTIDSEYIAVEFEKFDSFDEFYNCIKMIFDAFVELYPLKISTRVGLRFINQIRLDSGNPRDWESYIHKSLYSVANEFAKPDDKLLRSMHFLEVNEDGYSLKFQFGLFNSEYPNPLARKEFILDYDCVTREEIEIDDIMKKLKEFNDVISSWFEKSIMDGLRAEMGEL